MANQTTSDIHKKASLAAIYDEFDWGAMFSNSGKAGDEDVQAEDVIEKSNVGGSDSASAFKEWLMKEAAPPSSAAAFTQDPSTEWEECPSGPDAEPPVSDAEGDYSASASVELPLAEISDDDIDVPSQPRRLTLKNHSNLPKPYAMLHSEKDGFDEWTEKPVEQWTEADVASWVASLSAVEGMDEVVRCHGITGSVLLSMSEEDLAELNIKKFGHRRLLVLAAEELRAALERTSRASEPRADSPEQRSMPKTEDVVVQTAPLTSSDRASGSSSPAKARAKSTGPKAPPTNKPGPQGHVTTVQGGTVFCPSSGLFPVHPVAGLPLGCAPLGHPVATFGSVVTTAYPRCHPGSPGRHRPVYF